ncbi:glycosyltransferase family 1 protein [Nocardia sp. NRRL S-836]|uniref:glycosyltransferase family 4 protein n=1 Tax=Nocardia sp. NRRL S-836 TaxID=1519492 RepID=UPI0009E671C7|nr:glycosyltransferase family 1 protein [Nocardia sp. NRRL S-836]
MSAPLRVAVDLVFFTGKKGGTESYAKHLFAHLAGHDDLRFVGIGNRELAAHPPAWFPGEVVPLPVSGENRAAWAVAEMLAVGPRARGIRADVLHCPSNFGPAVRLLPTVVTVHDLLAARHPEWVPGGRAKGVQTLQKATARAANRIITISEVSANDIRELLGRTEVDVIPLGVAPVDPLEHHERPARPFVLASGNRMPHKNFARLVEAWTLIPRAERPKLVITGSHGDDPLVPLVEQLGLRDDVELLGWVTDAELERLYDTASAYAFPTLFEGFGLPVLEAMARGCPVAGSDIPILREVGGDAMRYFDPHDPASIARTVREVVTDPGTLADSGRKRATLFTWQRTADATADVYRRLAESGR